MRENQNVTLLMTKGLPFDLIPLLLTLDGLPSLLLRRDSSFSGIVLFSCFPYYLPHDLDVSVYVLIRIRSQKSGRIMKACEGQQKEGEKREPSLFLSEREFSFNWSKKLFISSSRSWRVSSERF